MDKVSPQLKITSWQSTRPRAPPQFNSDEHAAAMSLLLLLKSGGGFCSTTTTAHPTISPPNTRQEVSNSDASIVKQETRTSPNTPLPTHIYRCSICPRVFNSSQALGGHTTSHRAKTSVKAAVSEGKGRHECPCCHETFSSGQALGGHKRKHYNGPALVRKAAKCNSTDSCNRRAAGESSGENSDEGISTRPILIDLNLSPPPE